MKILIVEDDIVQNSVLKGFCEKEGLNVDSAHSLNDAFRLFNDEIKLVVLDLNLPDGNGFDFLKNIRKESNIPIIVLTGIDDELTQLNAFEYLADEFIDKPVSPLVMTKRIMAHIKRHYPETSNIRINNFYINFDTRSVTSITGENIYLTTKEYNFLKLLHEQSPRPVSRSFIITQLWGYEYRDEIRLLDTHVKNLRKKLGYDTIETIKNVGFRINKGGINK